MKPDAHPNASRAIRQIIRQEPKQTHKQERREIVPACTQAVRQQIDRRGEQAPPPKGPLAEQVLKQVSAEEQFLTKANDEIVGQAGDAGALEQGDPSVILPSEQGCNPQNSKEPDRRPEHPEKEIAGVASPDSEPHRPERLLFKAQQADQNRQQHGRQKQQIAIGSQKPARQEEGCRPKQPDGQADHDRQPRQIQQIAPDIYGAVHVVPPIVLRAGYCQLTRSYSKLSFFFSIRRVMI